MTESFSKLINSKLGDVKVVVEQDTPFNPQPGAILPGEEKDGGKSTLIAVMRDRLNGMSNDPKFDANAVAQVLYNNAAHFLNKTDIFRDQNKFGKPFPTRVPYAPKS